MSPGSRAGLSRVGGLPEHLSGHLVQVADTCGSIERGFPMAKGEVDLDVQEVRQAVGCYWHITLTMWCATGSSVNIHSIGPCSKSHSQYSQISRREQARRFSTQSRVSRSITGSPKAITTGGEQRCSRPGCANPVCSQPSDAK